MKYFEIEKVSFSFRPNAFNGPRHLFRMLQPEGSAARRVGYTLPPLIVSEHYVNVLKAIQVEGVRFKHIHTVDR